MKFHRNAAGLICFSVRDVTVHIAVRPKSWRFGLHEGWYDGPFYTFGLGPLVMFCW